MVNLVFPKFKDPAWYNKWHEAVNGNFSAIKAALDPVELRHGQTTTIYVSPTGSDANTGLTSSAPKQTIQAAFDVLAAQAPVLTGQWVVELAAGTYPQATRAALETASAERVIVRGPARGHPNVPTAIIDGAGGAGYSHGLVASGVGVKAVFRDLLFVNFTDGGASRIGCVGDNGADLWTDNVHATSSSWCGIYFSSATFGRVSGGIVDGCKSGIIVNNSGASVGYGGTSPIIRNSTQTGVEWSRGSQGHVDYCTFEDNAVGLVVSQNSRVNAVENHFKRNTYGMRATTGGIIDEGGAGNYFYVGTADAQIQADKQAFALSGWNDYLATAQQEVRVAYDRTTRTVTGTTAATDLSTAVWTIPARQLAGPGKQVRVRCFGAFTVTAGSVITVAFGGMSVGFAVAGAATNATFEVDVTLLEVAGGFRAIGHLTQGLNGIREAASSTGFDVAAAQAVTVRATPAATTDTVTLYRTDVYLMG